MVDLKKIIAVLGGEITNACTAKIPGPDRPRSDRSLTVFVSAQAPDGFGVRSSCEDDWQTCHDHVSAALRDGVLL